jgi:hypothetical protein
MRQTTQGCHKAGYLGESPDPNPASLTPKQKKLYNNQYAVNRPKNEISFMDKSRKKFRHLHAAYTLKRPFVFNPQGGVFAKKQ